MFYLLFNSQSTVFKKSYMNLYILFSKRLLISQNYYILIRFLVEHPLYLCVKTSFTHCFTKINRDCFIIYHEFLHRNEIIWHVCESYFIIILIFFHLYDRKTNVTNTAVHFGKRITLPNQCNLKSQWLRCQSDLCNWSNDRRVSSIMQRLGPQFVTLLLSLLIIRISVVSGTS